MIPRRLRTLSSIALLATAAAACYQAELTAAGATAAQNYAFAFDDAAADTLLPMGSPTMRALDARKLTGSVSDGQIVFEITFDAPISPSSAAAPNSLYGYLDIDLDENEMTGIPAYIDEAGVGQASMGTDYYLSLYDDGAGHVGLFKATTGDVVATGDATFAGTTLTIRLSRASLPKDDGRFRVSALVGTTERSTDLLPNSGHYSVHP